MNPYELKDELQHRASSSNSTRIRKHIFPKLAINTARSISSLNAYLTTSCWHTHTHTRTYTHTRAHTHTRACTQTSEENKVLGKKAGVSSRVDEKCK